MTPRLSAESRRLLVESCPLCGLQAHASEGVLEVQIMLLTCRHCRAFVMEKRLIDVIMNARVWNLRPVLGHVAFLSRAAQRAAAEGTVLFITSTNWIRLANRQQRLDETPAHAMPALSMS